MWWWVLIWVLLLLAALAVIVLLGWHLVRRGIALGRELGHSAEQVSDALAPVLDHYEPAQSVLSDPSTVPDAPPRRSPPGESRPRLRRVD